MLEVTGKYMSAFIRLAFEKELVYNESLSGVIGVDLVDVCSWMQAEAPWAS